MTLPSKELLSEVLDIKVVEVYKIGSNPNFKDNTLLYRVEGCGDLFTINMHEHISVKSGLKTKALFYGLPSMDLNAMDLNAI